MICKQSNINNNINISSTYCKYLSVIQAAKKDAIYGISRIKLMVYSLLLMSRFVERQLLFCCCSDELKDYIIETAVLYKISKTTFTLISSACMCWPSYNGIHRKHIYSHDQCFCSYVLMCLFSIKHSVLFPVADTNAKTFSRKSVKFFSS